MATQLGLGVEKILLPLEKVGGKERRTLGLSRIMLFFALGKNVPLRFPDDPLASYIWIALSRPCSAKSIKQQL